MRLTSGLLTIIILISIAVFLSSKFDLIHANIVDNFLKIFKSSNDDKGYLVYPDYNMTIFYPLEWDNQTQGWDKIPHQISQLFSNNTILDFEKNKNNHSKGFVNIKLQAIELPPTNTIKDLARSEFNKVKTLPNFSFNDTENNIDDKYVWLIDFKSQMYNGSKIIFVNEKVGFVFSLEAMNSNITHYRDQIIKTTNSMRFE